MTKLNCKHSTIVQIEKEGIKDNVKPSIELFDMATDITPKAGPPGKCCKAICSWKPGVWQQLPDPYQFPENCNYWASWWCKHAGYGPGPNYSHLEDAQWRTCG